MSRITKEIASYVAKELLKEKQEKIDKLKQERKDFSTDVIERSIPIEILSAFRDYPQYFKTTQTPTFRGEGLGWESYTVNSKFPASGNSIEISENTASKLVRYNDRISDLQRRYDDLFNQVEQSLIALRTYNNIEKEFPEAFKLLPARTSTAIMVNISDIRKQLA